jgi:hypothetical protein
MVDNKFNEILISAKYNENSFFTTNLHPTVMLKIILA